MQTRFQRISPFLWFDDQAEAAVAHYLSGFDDGRVLSSTRYSRETAEATGRPEGSMMTIAFELDGQAFTALNGGPLLTFNPSISLVVNCRDQREVDHYWGHLGDGGDPHARRCGWLKDRFGVSWQIVPIRLNELMNDPDPARVARVAQALMGMDKLDIAALERA